MVRGQLPSYKLGLSWGSYLDSATTHASVSVRLFDYSSKHKLFVKNKEIMTST